ncbi:hypothetical protein QMK33_03290 [Hymenobacter sp. H14-R3]|uniref:hypothetical protein n=1 Tax=Hymenobacter sp. H14-R3 TaxID=3046308 RepID=UPI0024B9EBBB|nr:hypothetical protein [Hymenobacter sp. H14-R3]MDJ0364163.1 hypothetical protein [Hymenobacter sp. H14-R3]
MTKPLSLLLLVTGLAGCQRTASSPEPEAAQGTTLVGSWRVTAYQCNCPPNYPLPNESVTFDASQHFKLYRNKVLAAEGTYATGQGSNCGGGTSEPIITLTASTPNTYVPEGAYTLTSNTLVIDQCSAADGPKYTYTRQ